MNMERKTNEMCSRETLNFVTDVFSTVKDIATEMRAHTGYF
jgi:hypothetical protein